MSAPLLAGILGLALLDAWRSDWRPSCCCCPPCGGCGPHRRRAVALPPWLTVATAAPLGVLVTGADLPNAFPYVIAVERLVSAGVPTATALPVLAGYAVVYCLPCLLLLGAGAAWGARVRARLERVHRRFGGERDVPRSVGAALGLAALAAAAAGVAVAA